MASRAKRKGRLELATQKILELHKALPSILRRLSSTTKIALLLSGAVLSIALSFVFDQVITTIYEYPDFGSVWAFLFLITTIILAVVFFLFFENSLENKIIGFSLAILWNIILVLIFGIFSPLHLTSIPLSAFLLSYQLFLTSTPNRGHNLSLFLAIACLFISILSPASPHPLSLFTISFIVGSYYSFAFLRVRELELAALEEQRKKQEEREKYNREREERERRSQLPLIENLRLTLQTPTTALPVAIDFPRLVNKMKIVNNNEEITIDPSLPTEAMMESVLVLLCRLTGCEDLANTVLATFSKSFGTQTGEIKTLDQLAGRFFTDVMGNESKPVRLLKACNQGAIAHGVLILKKSISMKFPYKDIRGEWWITISFNGDEVEVVHYKKEQSWTTKATEGFQFMWELRITLDKNIQDITRTSLKIVELKFEENTPDSVRKAVVEAMKEYYTPPQTNNNTNHTQPT